MNDAEAVRRFLGRLRPNARFIDVSHSSTFLEPESDLGAGFYYANIYDEDINANLNETKFGDVLIENSYLASFAYNLFLCWLFFERGHIDAEHRNKLLLYNLKKLSAEQLYRAHNSVRARTLLLESLLYEQGDMQRLFDAKSEHPDLFTMATDAAHLMLFLLNQHEFAHYMMRSHPVRIDGFLEANTEKVKSVVREVDGLRDVALSQEFRCDLYATLIAIHQHGRKRGPQFAIRAVAFSFGAYSSIYASAATARTTAAAWRSDGQEIVDLLSIEKRMMPTFELIPDWNVQFLRRTHFIHRVCERLAAAEGFQLYGDDGPFGLSSTVLDDLINPIQLVTICRDEKARQLSNLIAQAFSNCDEGFEFLYLRSKTYQTNRSGPLTV